MATDQKNEVDEKLPQSKLLQQTSTSFGNTEKVYQKNVRYELEEEQNQPTRKKISMPKLNLFTDDNGNTVLQNTSLDRTLATRDITDEFNTVLIKKRVEMLNFKRKWQKEIFIKCG